MIDAILYKLKKGPTIMALPDILSVMKELRGLENCEIIKNGDSFLEILDILVESYSDSGIFEVNDNNRFLLDDFNCWLVELGTKNPIGRNKDDLLAYVNTFSMKM